jgi:hypothetical protein
MVLKPCHTNYKDYVFTDISQRFNDTRIKLNQIIIALIYNYIQWTYDQWHTGQAEAEQNETRVCDKTYGCRRNVKKTNYLQNLVLLKHWYNQLHISKGTSRSTIITPSQNHKQNTKKPKTGTK